MDAVIFDMDGTLCDVRPIRHYVSGPRRNFDAFHKASLFCYPNGQAAWLARYYSHRYSIIIVTARDARYETVTRNWLSKWGVGFEKLYMRPWGDQRKDYEVKSDILSQIREDGYNPILAVDDNPDVIRLWEEEGIPTVIIPGWTEH